MQHQRSIWTALFLAFAASSFSAPAHALNAVSWVSGTGNDASACTRVAPCASFFVALSNTQINGEIRCLDAGNFGGANINKSITIDCHEVPAVVQALTVLPCFVVNLTTSLASDPAQTVKIRSVTCDGFGGGGGTVGVQIQSAAAVFLEDMLITDLPTQGVT